MRKWTGATIVLIGALLLVGLVACAPAAAPPKAQAPEKTALRVSFVSAAVEAPINFALKKGYFQAEGLTVELVPMRGTEALSAVVAGKMDLAASAITALFTGRDEGFDFVVVAPMAAMQSKPPDGYRALTLKGSGIKGYKDLEGKKVAVPLIKDITWLSFYYLVDKAGGDPKKVTFVELPFPQMPDALLNKQVDVIGGIEPFATILLETGKVDTLGFYKMEALPGADDAHYITTEKWVKENPVTLNRFVRALRKGLLDTKKDDAETRKLVAEYTKLNPEITAKMALPAYPEVASPKSLQETADLMYKYGILKKKHDAAKYVYQTALSVPK